MNDLITLNNLVKTYKTEAGKFMALKHIDLQIGEGEFVGVIGKSGSGKTTLINMITGIDRPTSGEIIVAGTPIHNLNENQMAQWRGRNMGIVFQFFQLLPNLTVIDNVILPMEFCNYLKPIERRDRAQYLLDMVDLQGQYDKLPSQLSGGQQQRVAIARALANDPPILFADEPTGNLDSVTSEKIFAFFETLIDKGKTILMVTHDEEQAKRVNRAIIISDGEIIEEHLTRVFPSLSEKDLVWMSSRLKQKVYKGGETILAKGQHLDSFYVINKGLVQIVLETKGMPEMVVAEYGRGGYFGEIELLRGGPSLASAKAAWGSDVELSILSKTDFENLLKRSEKTKTLIGKVAKTRLEENISKTKQDK